MSNPFPFVPNQLILGNTASPVAICCGWTPREAMKKRLEEVDPDIMKKICCIGQLYTMERGIDMMIRNLLAVPTITDIFFMGNDRTGAQKEFCRFILHGILEADPDGYWTSPDSKLRIGNDIPFEVLNDMRVKTCARDPGNDLHGMIKLIEHLNTYTGKSGLKLPRVFNPVREEPEDFPGPDNATVIRGKTVSDVYVKILYNIMTFGRRIHTHYDQDSKELMNLVAVITEQPVDGFDLPPFVPFSKEHLDAYRVKLLSPDKDPNVTYTYGNRMRLHFGVDQIQEVANKMVKEPLTRSAVVSLWDPRNEGSGSPCLNHLWFRIRDNALHMTATIRSNDMFFGWPENAYGLRFLQDTVRQMVMKGLGSFCEDGSLVLGDLVINSQSAHIYEDCWAPAQDVIKNHHRYAEWWDEKGQWIFTSLSPDLRIRAELFLNGLFITSIEGSATNICKVIAERNLISDIGHALYVGKMLGNLEKGK